MFQEFWTGLVVTVAVGVIACFGQDGNRPTTPSHTVSRENHGSKQEEAKPASPMAVRFAAIRAAYEAMKQDAVSASAKGSTDFERSKIYSQLSPDDSVFARRMVDLAMTDPQTLVARDVLLWVLERPGVLPWGRSADELGRAVILLLRHHADDLEVARIGLQLTRIPSSAHDMFHERMYVQAKGREAKGLVRLSLAQYLQMKAKNVDDVRSCQGNSVETKVRIQTYDVNGHLGEQIIEIPPETQAYRLRLRLTDPDATRAEAKRLFEEVVADYGDIPYSTRRDRALETVLKEPSPVLEGVPLSPGDRMLIKRLLAQRKTLADIASSSLDELKTTAVGELAPPIDGMGLDGKPLQLSDYRGKIVVLVFWATWCAPCMLEVPRERELAARCKDRPFALVGVDCDDDKDLARSVMKDEGITWPNWNDGIPGQGPIVHAAHHVHSLPCNYVLDAQGTIRFKNLSGSALDDAVDTLIKELESKRAR